MNRLGTRRNLRELVQDRIAVRFIDPHAQPANGHPVGRGAADVESDGLTSGDTLGIGVGTSFETKAGIFGLTYALGRQFDAPFELRSGKVHFGFTSLF